MPNWITHYSKDAFTSDAVASVIVAIMLIPQSLAYALLAGLPAEMGLYASILPLIVYALLGTSSTLSVGPVAVVSLMTATAVGKVASEGSLGYASAAIAMAGLSGFMLLGMGFLRLGFLSTLLSHPVVSGFISASGIVIAFSQLKHIFGVEAHGETLLSLVPSLLSELATFNAATLTTGIAVLVFLWWSRSGLSRLLEKCGIGPAIASVVVKAAPVCAIIVTTVVSMRMGFDERGVSIVGTIPSGLPAFSLPAIDFELMSELMVSALLISILGFVESVSVGRTLGAKRRERINPNREMVALGAANVASSISGGFPVTGGFSRSVVNFDAGAVTQFASVLAALGIALATLLLTPALYYLPQATLAATIIVAVGSLIDFNVLKTSWRFSKSDFWAVLITLLLTLGAGVEIGVLAGITVSIALHLYKTSHPHIAVVGEVPGTRHFRNVLRHTVVTHPGIVSMRIDESLYFVNADYLESSILEIVDRYESPVRHVVIQCSAVNDIDLSALEVLESINETLDERGALLHLSEVKGPVMDALKRSTFLTELTGQIFLSHHDACEQLSGKSSSGLELM